jgi:putative SOS response-associated peptidase YedK
MCGRYRRTTSEEELARIYKIPIPPQRDLPISWNIAPSQDVLAIRFNPKSGQRSLDALRWGLVPYWAKDDKIGYRTINARAESVDTAPSFRETFKKKRRCLIPADGFYEWKKVPGGGKIPYAIGMEDDVSFVFAGLWEGWKNPATEEWLRTCTIITGEPNELVGQVHTRMPVILAEEYHAKWLGELEDGDLKELLKPFPAERMKMWPISSRVNSPKNDDEAIVAPVEPLKFGPRGPDGELALQ